MTGWRSLALGCVAVTVLVAGCRQEPAAAPPSPAPSGRTIQEGVLSVACDVPSPPFTVERAGEITGFQADLIREVARRLGLDPVLVDVPAFRIHSDVAEGGYDAGLTAAPMTPELEEEVDFSEPYFRQTLALVISPERRPDVSTLDELALGDVVAVPDGTTAEAFAEQSLRPGGVEIRAYPDSEALYAAVETGLADAVVDYELAVTAQLAEHPSLRLAQVLSTGESFGIAVRPGHPALLDAINGALGDMVDDGTYQRLYGRYPELPPGGRVSGTE
jgi:polar amino acid transport system substrate-binding protein